MPGWEAEPGEYPVYAETDYAFTVSRGCFCPDAGVPIRVTVVDGEVVEAVYVGGGGRAGVEPGQTALGSGPPPLAELVERANDPDVALVEVTWPEGQDWPTEIFLDLDERAMDEEQRWVISDVEPS